MSPDDRQSETCAYCHLPLARPRRRAAERAEPEGPLYCCLGCRLAAEITGTDQHQGAARWLLFRLGLAIFLTMNVMMFTMALWSQELSAPRAAAPGALATSLADLFRYLCLVLALVVLFLLGGPMWENARLRWRREGAATDLLILLGVVAAYVYSAASVIKGEGHVYFEVGAVVLVMVTLGRWFEATGKLKTTEAIEALQRLLPERVRVVRGDGEVSTPLGELALGDRVRVLAGERIGADGRVLTERAAVDEQLVTGESQPVVKEIGDAVIGGSLNLEGDLWLEVMALPSAGTLARMVELVRQARLAKGRYERLADRVARVFLPAVVAIALATFAWHFARQGLEQAILCALAVLLIACPCALGLATPMAVWTAMGTASRRQVLFRNGAALERLAAVRAICFDKTGTLTTGTPQVARFVAADERARGAALACAAALASSSNHGFSQAICRWAGTDRLSARVVRAQTRPGLGVVGRFEGDAFDTCLGSLRLMAEQGLCIPSAPVDQPYPSDSWGTPAGLSSSAGGAGGRATCATSDFGPVAVLQSAIREALTEGASLSAIGWQGEVRGLFVFSEELRPQAWAALAVCRDEGCHVTVLTGDHANRGESLARELDVAVEAELLPDGKVAAIERTRARHGPVAMVGDGINDAPALAASDVGIALGCGADVSRESAAVCLLSNDLARLPWTIELARRTIRIVRQNLFWAFGYNTLGIGLAAAGWLNPAWAAAAMVASSLLVVTNSLRLSRADDPGTSDDPWSAAGGVTPGHISVGMVDSTASGSSTSGGGGEHDTRNRNIDRSAGALVDA